MYIRSYLACYDKHNNNYYCVLLFFFDRAALPSVMSCTVNIGRWDSIRLKHFSGVKVSAWTCLLDLIRMPLLKVSI